MTPRTLLFWCHLAAGALAGSVIFMMAATGVLLTYEKQVLSWADSRAAGIEPPAIGTPRASIAEMLSRVQDEWPDLIATVITRRVEPEHPVTMTLSDGRVVLLHPYSGAILGDAPKGVRRVFRTATDWHRYLGATGQNRTIGKAITGASNLAFLFILISGIYLWCPRRWTRKAFAAVTVPRRKHPSSKARDFNWHNALGFWSALPLVIVVASATVISYAWASDLAYTVSGEAPPPRPAVVPAGLPRQGLGRLPPAVMDRLDEAWQRAEAQVADWRIISLRPPAGSAPLAFTIDSGAGGQPHKRGTLFVDSEKGRVIRWEPFESTSPGRRFRSILRFAHTGEVAGLTGQTLAGLVSAVACVMVVTGWSLACRRLMQWRRRQAKEPLRRAA